MKSFKMSVLNREWNCMKELSKSMPNRCNPDLITFRG
jgi:hypothetical protein